ncbi:MAG: hypothetical protein ACO1ON_12990 [Nocardioides sp.]
MTHELTVEIPRTWWMTSNDRWHWAKRRQVVANVRVRGRVAAMQAGLPRGLEKVRIVAHMTYPDRRARDAHNAMPTLKALVDGVVKDHGLCADDDDKHVIGPDPRAAGITPGRYTVRLVIEEVGA